LFFLIQSCQPNLEVGNKLLIDNIDRLNINKTILEVSVDDYENVIDTLSIVKLKLNEDGITLYEFKESWNNNRKSIKKTYFRNNKDLFYQIFEIEKGDFKTVFETFLN
jgi:hypothetical protein